MFVEAERISVEPGAFPPIICIDRGSFMPQESGSGDRAGNGVGGSGGRVPPPDPVGAFCRVNHAAVASTASGPLSGLTFAAKDCFHIAGIPTGFGQPAWLATAPVPTVTATAVRQLLDAGASMVAKAHCDELCYSLTGENVHYGTPVNVNAPGRIPGGSSNGSAAAVAAGLVDFAIGTDCGGSVRIPASYCGILGIRPTHGRVSLEGVIPFGPSFDVGGWFARDPGIFERVGAVFLGPDPEPARLSRLVIAEDAFAIIEPRAREALQPAIEHLAGLLPGVAEVDVSDTALDRWFETFKVIQASEVWGNHGAWIERAQPQLGPGVKERMAWAAALETAAVESAKAERRRITARVDDLLQPGDVLCLPTSPRVAPLVASPVDKIEVEYREQAMRLLCIAGLNGLPQISLPLAHIDGLPLGLSIAGRRGSDRMLLGLAARLMARLPRYPA
jgi:amidase